MKNTLIIMLSVLFLIACNRTEELSYEDFDKNNDNTISKEEFVEVFTNNYYDDWNNTDDPYLDDEDFLTTVYGVWDVDSDELLTEEEWLMGYDYYYGDYIITDYVGVDADGDGFIEYTEYYDALKNTNFYSTWDVDASGFLEQEELALGVFSVWDINNDDVLNREEFMQFDNYYLDI